MPPLQAATSKAPSEPPSRFLRFETLHEIRFEQDHDFMNRQVVAGRNHTTSMDWVSLEASVGGGVGRRPSRSERNRRKDC